MEIQGLKFRNTCGACPEQYDVFLGEEEVGYARLRWGVLRGDCRGTTVYTKNMADGSDGIFNSDESRMKHLNEIATAIHEALNPKPQSEAMRIISELLDNIPTDDAFIEEFNTLHKHKGISIIKFNDK